MRKRNHKTRPLNTALHLCFQIQLPSMTKQRYPTTCHQLVKCLIQISIKNLIWLAKREAYREKSTSSSKQHTCIELVTLNVPFQIYDQCRRSYNLWLWMIGSCSDGMNHKIINLPEYDMRPTRILRDWAPWFKNI